MYLHKPFDLINPDMDIETQASGVYSARILLNDKVVGHGAVATIHQSTGFEGLITLEGVQYQIVPLSENQGKRINENTCLLDQYGLHRRKELLKSKIKARRSLIDSNILVVPHKMTLLENNSSTENDSAPRGTDTKRLDPEVLEKAYEEMLRDQENLTDEDEEEELENTEKSPTKEFSSQPLPGHVNNTTRVLYQKVPSRKHFIQRKKKKRIARVVELAIFTDETFYRKWSAKYPTETEKHINKFILTLVNNMNYLYSQPSMKQRISFRLVRAQIQKSAPIDLTTAQNGERYLDNFCAFAGNKNENGAIWDHAMMITGIDINDGGNQDLLGIAFSSTMCLRYYSCSLVKLKKGFETLFTATHEVGHTLGMEHDGEFQNKKCNPSKFIMASHAGRGQINWSPCSNVNVQNYFASGDPVRKIKAPKYIPRCLTKRGSSKSRIPYQKEKLPGETFKALGQCQTACKGCTPYVTQTAPYNNICWMLHCKNSNGQIFSAHPALEGTACGKNKKKRCRYGKCQ